MALVTTAPLPGGGNENAGSTPLAWHHCSASIGFFPAHAAAADEYAAAERWCSGREPIQSKALFTSLFANAPTMVLSILSNCLVFSISDKRAETSFAAASTSFRAHPERTFANVEARSALS